MADQTLSEKKPNNQLININDIFNAAKAPIIAEVNIDGDVNNFWIDEEEFDQWIEGESTLDAKTMHLIAVKPLYFNLVKYPFCTPKITMSNKKKKQLFRKMTHTYFILDNWSKDVQVRSIKEIRELEGARFFETKYRALDASHRHLLDDYEKMVKW